MATIPKPARTNIAFEALRPGMVVTCENIHFDWWNDPKLKLVVLRISGNLFEDRWETKRVQLLNMEDKRPGSKTRVFWAKDMLRFHVLDATGGSITVEDLLRRAA